MIRRCLLGSRVPIIRTVKSMIIIVCIRKPKHKAQKEEAKRYRTKETHLVIQSYPAEPIKIPTINTSTPPTTT